MGLKVLQGQESLKGTSGGKRREWDAFIRIADGVTLEFVYLDDLQDDTPDDHKVVQWYEYAWLEGTTNGKTWNVNIPCAEDDERYGDLAEQESKYQYASNIFIVKAFWTETGDECELDGDGMPDGETWKSRSLEDRVKVLASGKQTSNDFLAKLKDWKEDGEGAPGHLMRMDRAKENDFTKYTLRFVKNFDPKLPDEVEELRHDIMKLLEDKREFGLVHCGYKQPASDRGSGGGVKPKGRKAPVENSEEMAMEGDGEGGDEDIFDEAARTAFNK